MRYKVTFTDNASRAIRDWTLSSSFRLLAFNIILSDLSRVPTQELGKEILAPLHYFIYSIRLADPYPDSNEIREFFIYFTSDDDARVREVKYAYCLEPGSTIYEKDSS